MQTRYVGLRRIGIGVSTVLLAALVPAAEAQTNNNPFGLQDRADAASQMIVLGVQQGISSLPPTSGQAFTYDFNSELGSFVESEQLGPTVLRSTQTIGARRLSLRFATSYFEMSKTLAPLVYSATGGPIPPGTTAYTEFGLSASANVTLFNFAATYGITDRIEATINIPFSVVQAKAFQTFLAVPGTYPPIHDAEIGAVGGSPDLIRPAIQAGLLNVVTASFNSLNADFNDGTHVGLGRISVGGKANLYASDLAELAFSTEVFCNSPNQDDFAGSNSASLLPRVIGQVHAAKHLNLHMDVGYERDFSFSELSRFVWNTGASIPLPNATIDFGLGGSKFDEAIQWTPGRAKGGDGVVIRAIHPNATLLGTDFVDFLFGVKVRLFEGTVLGGGVNVPVNTAGFRPDAVGTVSLEYYFKPI
jgi:hypothetical protein